MVEAASIDKQAHNMDTERWVLDTVEFDRAVQKAIDFAATPAGADTLIVVTADHECAGINIIGSSTVTNATLVARSTANGTDGVAGGINGAGPVSTDGQLQLRDGVVGTYESALFPAYAVQPDGYPLSMDVDYKMLIGYAGNGNRYEDWLTNPTPYANPATGRDLTGDFFIAGQASANSSAVHTASDIPLSAGGRGSSLFTGTMENVDVFFKAMQALIGGAK
jgi:alkaline phosphatase